MAKDLFVPQAAAKRPALVAVVGLHVALIALLVTGTAQRLVTAVTAPVKVALLEPPEQPPPPEPAPLPQAPPLEPPRPVFVPPPEVHIARPKPAVPVVRSTSVVAPPSTPVAPPTTQPAAPTNVAVAGPPRDLKPARDLTRPAKIVVAQCDQPTYPASARREEATGTSRIRFEVDASGHVVHAEIVQRSGRSRAHRQLDQAAVDALSRCEFTPGRDKLGHPTGGYASVDYVWRLE